MYIILSLPADEASPWMELFAAALPGAELERHEPDQPVRAGARRADYVVAAYPSSTLFAEQPSPKAVFTVSAGVAHVLRMPNMPRQVPLVRVEDAGMSAQMIRYVLTAAMRHTQRLDTYRHQQLAREWRQHPPRAPASLHAGVMGLGVIGSAIANALVQQGYVVRGYAQSAKSLPGIRCHAGRAQFAEFLSGLDVLVNVLPATPDTTALLDRIALGRLAAGAHFVNVGRGNVLVEADLLAALDSGQVAGATLDVFSTEPLPRDHPFWTRPEITLTPHVAGLTVPDETAAQVAAKMLALERGERISGVVDRERGY